MDMHVCDLSIADVCHTDAADKGRVDAAAKGLVCQRAKAKERANGSRPMPMVAVVFRWALVEGGSLIPERVVRWSLLYEPAPLMDPPETCLVFPPFPCRSTTEWPG